MYYNITWPWGILDRKQVGWQRNILESDKQDAVFLVSAEGTWNVVHGSGEIYLINWFLITLFLICKGTELFCKGNMHAELSFCPHKPDFLHQLFLLHCVLKYVTIGIVNEMCLPLSTFQSLKGRCLSVTIQLNLKMCVFNLWIFVQWFV